MERQARSKKPSKAEGALASLRAIKSGQAKAMDAFDLEDVGEYENLSDGEDERMDEEGGLEMDDSRKTSKVNRESEQFSKKRAAGLAKMQAMFANAPVKKMRSQGENDGLLDQLLSELDAPNAAVDPKKKTSRSTNRRASKIKQSTTFVSPKLEQECFISDDKAEPAGLPDSPLQPSRPPKVPLQSSEDHSKMLASHKQDDMDSLQKPNLAMETGSHNESIEFPMQENAESVPASDHELPKNRMCILPEVPDSAPGQASGWQVAVETAEGTEAPIDDENMDIDTIDQESTFITDTEASGDTIQFFFIDAVFEPAMAGTVLLIGKMRQAGEFISACVTVRDMSQCLFFIPKPFVFQDTDGEISSFQTEVESGTATKKQLLKVLHERSAQLKAEVRNVLGRYCSDMTMKPVQRTYAFEDPRIPAGPQWVLKVKCNAVPGSVPSTLTGYNFSAVLGTTQTPLEALQLKRKIMGPSWLQIENTVKQESQAQVSWCKVEYSVSGHKCVHNVKNPAPMPLLKIAAINVKSVPDASEKAQEIVSISVLHTSVQVDRPMDLEKWRSASTIKRFSSLTPPSTMVAPGGLQNMIKAENSRFCKANGGDAITLQASERALLSYFLARWHALDADIVLGHNIGPWDLTLLLQRMQHYKVSHFSRIGRLKRQRFPNLSGGGNMYGGGASMGVLTCFAGRLLLDTYVCSRDLLKEVEYSLATLSSKLLNQQRTELHPQQVRQMCEDASTFIQLARHSESDAWLALGLSIYLSAIPLTLQLSTLSGFLWSRTLQGNRAQRIEMLLLHEFHSRKFLLPDKPGKPTGKAPRKDVRETGEEPESEKDTKATKAEAKSKGPQYAGGLVLEPKKGIYNKFVLLLDFNSLYPSIIQEYNICFTTVQRPDDDSIPPLPHSGSSFAPLPIIIQGLVHKRRSVKSSMKNCTDAIKRQQLDIRQQALKLTANSMYGCLGFTASRFYAKPLAQLITQQGRDILQRTVELVQGSLNLDVVYGDTDSIMISTGSTDMAQVLQLGEQAKRAINKHYRLLEIDIDGVFKSMLLLKKKKYAAIKMVPRGNSFAEALECKGIDIVRRDWCMLCRDVGHQCLQEILSGKEEEDIVETVHELLRTVRDQVSKGQVELSKFVITKQLTKQPEEYPDAKSQAHVQVALRMRAKGAREGTRAGNVVQYVICTNSEAPTNSTGGLASRAYHPEEIVAESNLSVDTQYYLSHQLHPVVARLCAPLEMTSDARIAECLGLDPTKFRNSVSAVDRFSASDPLSKCVSVLDDDDRFSGLTQLQIVDSTGSSLALPDFGDTSSWESGWSIAQQGLVSKLDAAQLCNQAVLAGRSIMKKFYNGALSTEEVSKHVRDISLAPEHPRAGPCLSGTCPLDPTCLNAMEPVLSEAQAYLELTHIARQLDVSRVAEKVPNDASSQQQYSQLLGLMNPAATAVQGLISTVSFHWVNLNSLFSSLLVS